MRRIPLALVFLALGFAACGDEALTGPYPCLPCLSPPPPSSPENLALAVEVVFNDKIRTSVERREEYEKLFGPDFELRCHVDEPDSCFVCPCRSFTIDGAAELFAAQESGAIHSLQLAFSIKPATDLDPPQPGRENWKMVFLRAIHLRVMFNPNDGLEVSGGEAVMLAYPSQGRWFIGEWIVRRRSQYAGAVTIATPSSYH